MKDLTLSHFFDMGTMGFKDPEARIEKMHDWYYARSLAFAQLIAGLAGALLAGILVGLFKNEFKDAPWWEPLAALSVCMILLYYAGTLISRLRSIQKDYLAALTALQWARSLRGGNEDGT